LEKSDDLVLRSVESWTLPLPLTRPVQFGAMRFTSRDYAIVRLTDEAGRQGAAFGMARGAPVAAAVQAMAPLALGRPLDFSERLWDDLYAASITWGQRGVALRALSLIDIAAWDLRARAAGLPLFRYLGGVRDTIPVSIGGGYYREARPLQEIADELSGYVARGFRHVKIPVGGLEPEAEEQWVRNAREAVGASTRLALDAHWTWQDVMSARRVMERLDQFRLDWVEDPLWPEAVTAAAELRRHIATPVAIGDELSGRWAYQQLLLSGAADILRVDVTVAGGFTEFRRIAALAATWGTQISTHIYPDIHVHCAATERMVIGVEYTDPGAEIDLYQQFIDAPGVPAGGVMPLPTRPGLGFELDWELIEKTASERFPR
jgi:L-alanine-DL-glutamate epimerase-like enolase superfamily enzyme